MRLAKNEANNSLVQRYADELGMTSTDALAKTLKQQIFKDPNAGNGDLMMYLQRCHALGSNPLSKELQVWKSGKQIIFYVGIDGWAGIVNRHPDFDGVEFSFSENQINASGGKTAYEWCKCTIYRKSFSKGISVTEYFDEVAKGTSVWADQPKRMHRHKAFMQCARLAFGMTSVFSEDDLETVSQSHDPSRNVKPVLSDDQIQQQGHALGQMLMQGMDQTMIDAQLDQLEPSQAQAVREVIATVVEKGQSNEIIDADAV